MRRKVVFRPLAEKDINALYLYIVDRAGRSVAGNYIGRLEAACMDLADFPERGTRRDDLLAGLRVIGFERRAAIAFLVEPDTVRIIRIFYGGQAFPDDWSRET